MRVVRRVVQYVNGSLPTRNDAPAKGSDHDQEADATSEQTKTLPKGTYRESNAGSQVSPWYTQRFLFGLVAFRQARRVMRQAGEERKDERKDESDDVETKRIR